MKKIILLIAFFLAGTCLIAQSLLYEDFSGTFPPAGWTIDFHSANWSASNTTYSGCVAPEATFYYYPSFTGTSSLVSPVFNLTGVSKVNLEFHHMIDNFSGNYSVGVATRTGTNGNWNTVWQFTVANSFVNINPSFVSIPITNSNVNHPDFQFCFYYSGSTNGIYNWYIDNVYLYIPYNHDIRSENILTGNQVVSGNPFTPSFRVRNIGKNSENFPAVFEVLDYQENLVYKDSSVVSNLAMDSTRVIFFSNYSAPDPDALYKEVFYANMLTDQDHSNDTLSQYMNTYSHKKQEMILEIGTGTWCNYCPGASMGAEDLISHGDSVAVIEYHDADIFSNSAANDRVSYYNMISLPTAMFDGTLSYSGGSHSASMYPYYLPLYTEEMGIKTPFEMYLYGSHTGNNYSVDVNVHRLGQFINTRTVLHLALTENHISYPWEDQDSLQYVCRLMVPDAHGTPIDMVTTDSRTVHLEFLISSLWVAKNLELSTFIQDTVTREIYNGNKIRLSDLVVNGTDSPKESSNRIGNSYPNPFITSLVIPVYSGSEGQAEISIWSMMGLKCKILYSGRLNPGRHNFRWDGTDENDQPLPAGLYYCQMVKGGKIFSQKIILNR